MLRLAGGQFTSTFPEVKDATSASVEYEVLTKIIEDYNSTNNPGKYSLRTDPDGQFTIVGTKVRGENGELEEISPLLDTPVTVVKETRSVFDTVRTILDAVSANTGKKVLEGVVPNNEFRDTQMMLSGEKVPARELLNQAFASIHHPLQYALSYDPNVPVYFLSVSVAVKTTDNGHGDINLVPLDRVH